VIQLYVLVEGQTEEVFVGKVLWGHTSLPEVSGSAR